MSFNVSNFRNSLRLDGARPNLFDVTMAGPGVPAALSDLRFKCKTAELPASTMGFVSVPYFGRELKFAGNRTFPDWTVTVINDEDFQIRNIFERWMGTINSHVQNFRNASRRAPASYVAQGIVNQYGKSGASPIKQYNFVDIFPINIGEIGLDWGANDQIEEFQVTFAYSYWLSNTTDTNFGVSAAVVSPASITTAPGPGQAIPGGGVL